MMNQLVVSVFEFLEDVSGEVVLDLTMASNGLTGASSWILIPIVTTTVPDKNTPVFLHLANQVNPLHAI